MSKIALLFPGQGAQAVGMGKALCDALPGAKETFGLASEILGFSLEKLCFEGPASELTRTDNAQVAIYVTSLATLRGLEAAGHFDPGSVEGAAGLSLGEYSAHCFAGTIDFEAGLRLVRLRGTAMQEASEAQPSGMVSLIGADEDSAAALCDQAREDGILVVANLNAPGQVVISGDRDACARAAELAKGHGIRRAIPLDVAGAFHSPVMEPARERLKAALDATSFADPRIPVYANVSSEAVLSGSEARRLLSEQVVAPVRWADSIRRMMGDGFDRYLEPEPGRVLAGIMKKIDRGVSVRSLNAESGNEGED